MELTVYSASWCRDCREAKRFLNTHNIPFKEIDIEQDPGAADLVLANVGKPYRPGRGFLHDEMAELFGVSNG
jgi:mycoredoxin